MNRFLWDMRYPDARKVQGGTATHVPLTGPLVPPGTYQVRLTVEGHSQTQSFELLKDPRITASDQDMQEQSALLIRIRDKLSETHDAVDRVRSVRRQVDEWVARSMGHDACERVSGAADLLKNKLSSIEEELIQVKGTDDLDRLSLPARLNAKLAELTSVPASADVAPTQQSYDVFNDLSARVDAQLRRLQAIDADVAAFVKLVHEMEIPAIDPKSPP